MVRDVVGGAGGENARVAADEERPFEESAALVVQKIFVPAILDQFGNDHDNLAVGVLGREFENELDNRNNYETIGRRQADELGWFDTGGAVGLIHVAFPIHVQKFRMIARLDMDGDNFRLKLRSNFERLFEDRKSVV